MQLTVDPGLQLLRALIPGEKVPLRQARKSAGLSEAAFAESVAVLSSVLPELDTRAGSLLLPRDIDLYDPERFCHLLPGHLIDRIGHVSINAVCDSTSNDVTNYPAPALNGVNISLSEFQTGGRGRHGRSWSSGFSEGLCLTVAARMTADLPIASTATLAIGVRVAALLDTHVSQPVLLKWPNDLILVDGKLGGILVELSALPGGDHLMRIGVGVNCVVPDVERATNGPITLNPAALFDHANTSLDRSLLAAQLVAGVIQALDIHSTHGFEAFRANWQERDFLLHRRVQVFDNDRVRNGVATGIDRHGALRVATDEGTLTLMSGEVRVRRR